MPPASQSDNMGYCSKYNFKLSPLMKILLFLTLVLFSSVIHSQPFEGKVVYQNSVKSKVSYISDNQLAAMFGDTLEYYIRQGDYKSFSNNTSLKWQLYINQDNKLYNKLDGSETVFWYDGATSLDSVYKIELNLNVTEIMGYICNELVLICKSGVQKYYFNSAFTIDPTVYSNHKFGNWYDYVSRAKSVVLKSVIDNSQYTIESVAVEIKPMKIDANFFELPVGTKTKKSPI